ncbi:MAG: invasion associated locus B family protein [Tabrizicola sp.]|nr:invasion associated locus B family protein [Tabrizicola sp.]
MANTPLSALAAILMSLALPVTAQTTEAPAADGGTTEAPAAEGTTEAPAGDAVSPDGLSLGSELGGEGGAGSTYVAAKFEAWEQRCVRAENGADTCQLYVLLKDTDGNSVGEFAMFGLPKGSEGPAVAGATFIAPLETLLTAGMQMQIDGGKPKVYPFTFCAPVGCVARIGFTSEEVAQMKKGAKAVINIVPFVAPDQKVSLEVSLKGFTAGFEAVNAVNDKADAAAAAAKPAEGAAPAAP